MAVTLLPPTNDKLVVVGDILSAAPDVLFAYWTQPDLIRKWWPQEAEIDPRPGGGYHFSWPQRNWHLRGNYTAFEPLTDGGTRITLTHNHFSDSAEGQEMRLSHLEGWEYFIGKLQDLKPA